MPSLLQQAMTLLLGVDPRKKAVRPLKKLTDRELIKLESEIGRTLFGDIPGGHVREFFCLDADTWIWYEQWQDDQTGKMKSATTRYEVHPNGILKAQEGGNYSFLEGNELRNLALATRMYHERVMRELYKRDPNSGALLTETPAIIPHT